MKAYKVTIQDYMGFEHEKKTKYFSSLIKAEKYFEIIKEDRIKELGLDCYNPDDEDLVI